MIETTNIIDSCHQSNPVVHYRLHCPASGRIRKYHYVIGGFKYLKLGDIAVRAKGKTNQFRKSYRSHL